MQLTIKRYEAKEEEQLKQLLYFCFEEEVFINVINGSRLKFAFSACFREIRRTYMPNLKVSDVVHYISYHSEEYKIITLAEIISDETLLEKLTLLVKRTYEETHILNSVGEIEVEQWKRMLLADDILSDGSYIYLDNEEKNIIAYAFLHESDKENSFELGWCGAADIKNKGLIPHLINYQAKYAMKHNKQFISGEFDTTDIYAMEVIGSFPFAPCPAWITYQKE